MKYSAVTLSALAAVAAAQPYFTNTEFNLVEGEPFTLEFEDCTDTCTIILQNGESDDLQDVETLSSSASGGSLTVNLDTLPEDMYNFQIIDNETGEENWSVQFAYGSGEAVSSSVSSSEEPSSTSASSTSEVTSVTTVTSVETTEAESTTSAASETTEASSTEAATTTSDSETSATSDASATESSTVPDSAAGRLASPLALVAGAVVAMVYLN